MNIGKRENKYITRLLNFVSKNRQYFLGIFVVGLIINIFFLANTLAILRLLLFALAIILIWTYKVAYYVSFRIMGTFLLFSFLFLLISNEIVADKLAIWAYLFLLIGATQYLFYLRKTLD